MLVLKQYYPSHLAWSSGTFPVGEGSSSCGIVQEFAMDKIRIAVVGLGKFSLAMIDFD